LEHRKPPFLFDGKVEVQSTARTEIQIARQTISNEVRRPIRIPCSGDPGKGFSAALTDIEDVLLNAAIPIAEIIGSGGGEAKGTQRLRRALNDLGWRKENFEIKKIINGVEKESISHEVDHVKAFPETSRVTNRLLLRSSGTTRIHFSTATWRTLSGCTPKER